MSVPARYRDELLQQCEGKLTLTRHPDGCLMLFPRPTWAVYRQSIADLPQSARFWKRIFLGSAADVELDSAARILITPELRAEAKLEKDLLLVGLGSYFEIWDSETLQQREREAIAAGIPEALSNFSL